MEPNHNNHFDPPCLPELLRRILSLVEYYGGLEAEDSTLSELKTVLIRTIERLDADEAARHAANEAELDDMGSLRKGPYGETIDTTA